MKLKDAFEKNFALVTEYGGGVKGLGGRLNRRLIKHKRYKTDGESVEDTLHETELYLGPLFWLVHRSKDPNLFKSEDYELDITVLGLLYFGNRRDWWLEIVRGPSLGILGMIPGVVPTAVLSEFVDADVTARAGARFNLTGFIRALRGESDEYGDPPLWPDDEYESEEECAEETAESESED